jgi:hypothetical protein
MGEGLEESCVLYVHIWARTNDTLILHLFQRVRNSDLHKWLSD